MLVTAAVTAKNGMQLQRFSFRYYWVSNFSRSRALFRKCVFVLCCSFYILWSSSSSWNMLRCFLNKGYCGSISFEDHIGVDRLVSNRIIDYKEMLQLRDRTRNNWSVHDTQWLLTTFLPWKGNLKYIKFCCLLLANKNLPKFGATHSLINVDNFLDYYIKEEVLLPLTHLVNQLLSM